MTSRVRRSSPVGHRTGHGRHAARAVALGEAARRDRGHRTGRRALAATSRRQGERARTAEEGGAAGRGWRRGPVRGDHARARAARSPARVRAADHRDAGRLAARGVVGRRGSICFEALVPRVLRTPSQVLRVLADLRPMAEVGPIDLDEARRVLAERLLLLEYGSAGAPLRPRVRRHAASGARPRLPRRVRARVSPSGCFRRSRARMR